MAKHRGPLAISSEKLPMAGTRLDPTPGRGSVRVALGERTVRPPHRGTRADMMGVPASRI